MLFKQVYLRGVAAGELDLAFRRWERPRVKPGSTLRTSIGVLRVEAVDQVPASKITRRQAERAGFDSKQELIDALDRHGKGPIHRVRLRLVGEDPRIALRRKAPSAAEADEVVARLEGMDRRSRRGPWTADLLRLIGDHPGVRAGDLAPEVGRELRLFKADVRKLKELGLTESLEVGYRLSARGRMVLRRLEKRGAR